MILRKLIIYLGLSSLTLFAGVTPSVLMFHEYDIQNCPKQVEKALKDSKGLIHLLFTGRFTFNKDKSVKNFCYMNAQWKCEALNKQLLKRVYKQIGNCIKSVPQEVELGITLHLNGDGEGHFWRNELILNPLEKIQGYSYFDFLVKPVLAQITKRESKTYFSLQGEMGATIFSNPLEYLEIINLIKHFSKSIDVGVSLNFNKVTGGFLDYNSKDLNELFKAIDFLGFSAYGQVPVKVKEKHFRSMVYKFIKGLNKEGVLVRKDLPLQFSEIALGGGSLENNGWDIAKSPNEAASAPYSGVGGFDANHNPWANKALNSLRVRYFKELNKFLKNQHRYDGYLVKRAFWWNTGSWDIHGLYSGMEGFRSRKLFNN